MYARLSLIIAAVAAVAAFAAPPAVAQKFQVGSVYVCPNSDDTGLDCYLDAVVHLYTMCRHVKSIEIIEFGHVKAQEGVNGAKSEYCVDKQKINITKPYQAALREATAWHEAVEDLRTLQQFWLDAMANLRWQSGEPGDVYEDRVNKVYDELSWKIDDVRVAFTTPPDAAGDVRAAAMKPGSGADKARTKTRAGASTKSR